MKREYKKHFRLRDGKPACGCSSKLLTLVPTLEETTCKTCLIRHEETRERELRSIGWVLDSEVMSEAEIDTALLQAFTGAEDMRARCRDITSICTLVLSGTFTNDELVEAFKTERVKRVMNA